MRWSGGARPCDAVADGVAQCQADLSRTTLYSEHSEQACTGCSTHVEDPFPLRACLKGLGVGLDAAGGIERAQGPLHLWPKNLQRMGNARENGVRHKFFITECDDEMRWAGLHLGTHHKQILPCRAVRWFKPQGLHLKRLGNRADERVLWWP